MVAQIVRVSAAENGGRGYPIVSIDVAVGRVSAQQGLLAHAVVVEDLVGLLRVAGSSATGRDSNKFVTEAGCKSFEKVGDLVTDVDVIHDAGAERVAGSVEKVQGRFHFIFLGAESKGLHRLVDERWTNKRAPYAGKQSYLP